MNGYPPPMGYPPMRPLVAPPFPYPAPMGYMPPPYPMGAPGMPPMPMAAPYVAPIPGMPIMGHGMPMPPVVVTAPPQLTPVTTGTIVKPPAAPSAQGQKHTTVYVGKIAPSVEDDFLRSLLQQCGPVASWKRVTDPINNQARAFGFCTYESAEGVLRAIRLLNDFELDEQRLLVKVDDNTKQYLEKYEQEKRLLEERAKAQSAAEPRFGGEYMDDKELSTEELDQQVRNKINALVAERKTGVFFDKYFQKPDGEDGAVIPVAEGEVVAGHEIDKQKAVVVAQEIKNFRVRQAMRDKEKKDREDEDGKPDKDRTAGKEYEREQRERERERARVREQRARDREREARRREREKREFREREKEWIAREKEKDRERERREREDERERERQLERELNYNEEEDRQMRKAGRRKRIREREQEEDQEDRNAELEEERMKQEKELELIRQKQQEEEEARRREEERQREEEARRRPQRVDIFAMDYEDDSTSRTDSHSGFISSSHSIDQRISQAKKLGFGFASDTQKRPRITPGFNPEEEPNPLIAPKKKKLIPLDPIKSEEQLKKEREEEAKAIVKLIPTGKDELFVFSMDWETIDTTGIINKRMRPWVTKKIVEYLGEEEPTLIDFVVSKMADHMAPQEILSQLVFVLEDEAEVFVIKLWRMLIFEMIRAQRDRDRERAAEN